MLEVELGEGGEGEVRLRCLLAAKLGLYHVAEPLDGGALALAAALAAAHAVGAEIAHAPLARAEPVGRAPLRCRRLLLLYFGDW